MFKMENNQVCSCEVKEFHLAFFHKNPCKKSKSVCNMCKVTKSGFANLLLITASTLMGAENYFSKCHLDIISVPGASFFSLLPVLKNCLKMYVDRKIIIVICVGVNDIRTGKTIDEILQKIREWDKIITEFNHIPIFLPILMSPALTPLPATNFDSFKRVNTVIAVNKAIYGINMKNNSVHLNINKYVLIQTTYLNKDRHRYIMCNYKEESIAYKLHLTGAIKKVISKEIEYVAVESNIFQSRLCTVVNCKVCTDESVRCADPTVKYHRNDNTMQTYDMYI